MNQRCSARTTGVTLADVGGGSLRVLRASRGVRGALRVTEGALTVRGAASPGDDVVELPLAWVDGAHGRRARGVLRPGLVIVDAHDPVTAQRLSLVVTTARGVDAIALAGRVADAAAATRESPARSPLPVQPGQPGAPGRPGYPGRSAQSAS